MSHRLFWPTEDGSDLLGLGQVNVGNCKCRELHNTYIGFHEYGIRT